jgi:hypothetical protein
MAPALRREHLRNLLLEAEANGYADKAADIRTIMDREGMKRMWWSIRHSMNDKTGESVTRVERVVDGRTEEFTAEDDVIAAIQEETEVRFHLANSAPICQGLLAEQLGLLADTEAAQRILDGTYVAGPDIDDATTLLLQEIGRLGCMLTNGEVLRLRSQPRSFRNTGGMQKRPHLPPTPAFTLAITKPRVSRSSSRHFLLRKSRLSPARAARRTGGGLDLQSCLRRSQGLHW